MSFFNDAILKYSALILFDIAADIAEFFETASCSNEAEII